MSKSCRAAQSVQSACRPDVVAPYSCLNKKGRHLARSRARLRVTCYVSNYSALRISGINFLVCNYFGEAQI